MRVLKFGGTSVGDAACIQKTAAIVLEAAKTSRPLLVVCSAMTKVTDQLLEMAKVAASGDTGYQQLLAACLDRHRLAVQQLLHGDALARGLQLVDTHGAELEGLLHGSSLLRECSPRTRDLVASFGERLSCQVMTLLLQQHEPQTRYFDTRELIKTDNQFGSARVDFETTNPLLHTATNSGAPILMLTGFIGSTAQGETTTLGRGGSDYTAAIVGAAVGADAIEIWTDVDGVLTADPRRVADAEQIPEMTYVEAMELSHFGAKVIYAPTMQPARKARIPLLIKNTFNPSHPGTRIHDQAAANDRPITGLSSIDHVSLLRIQGSGMVGVSGVAARLFKALADEDISAIVITQGSSEHSICVAVVPESVDRAVKTVEHEFSREIHETVMDRVRVEPGLSVVAIVGDGMRRTPGMAGRIFQALGNYGINIVAIAQGSSERNITCVLSRNQVTDALRAIHDRFFTARRAPVHVFLAGAGLIGTTLLQQISELPPDQTPQVRIHGLINSKRMLLSEQSTPAEAKKQLDTEGASADPTTFVEQIILSALPNRVFVDATASEQFLDHYERLLKAGVHVVTPNKRAASGPMDRYQRLRKAPRGDTRFFYETNVGAGLPVISVIRSLRASGDHIRKIEGTLSGTLSYLFNTFAPQISFTELLRDAKAKGFTEPDPRDDLSGMDVARKLLILAREIGLTLELADIQVENLVPEPCRATTTVEAFFETLQAQDPTFSQRATAATAESKVLRYVAAIEDGRARVALEAVPLSHPCANLSGSDNLIAFTTDRYSDRPLVVRGPGAGAAVTAAGVLSDILSCSQ